ncbi:hypothetical protein [Pseudoduganella chitinolytica]|uniref:Acyltransferase family protein n=1 Tax=Pseudoduganella chitinolytica TaxID=34070 RepID=A0ABY8BMV4_9BURK|nr:hypothetical protein [Pseudoduganella chitinolytica]WEF35689.1 hypothetical protein PX653_13365 [Pseudoduganella chitinolytica]
MARRRLDVHRLGALHGFYLIVNHAFRAIAGDGGGLPRAAFGLVATWLAVIVAWVVFRASSMEVAWSILRAMAGDTAPAAVHQAMLGSSRIMPMTECLWWLAACAGIALLLPNAYQLLGKGLLPALEARLRGARGGLLLGALVTASALLLAISETRGVSEFLYFNF